MIILKRKIKVFIAGDSTAATKLPDKKPETGWGERIVELFSDSVEFINFALNGRSSKSFIDEGHLQKIKDLISSGDFLFIQFGHNDEKSDIELHTDAFTTYKSYLKRYIEVAQTANATPVLLTSIQRRNFNENKEITDTHGDYPIAMRELAIELNVNLIDMNEKTRILFNTLGPEKTKEIFLWVSPNESPNYPEGLQDNTHFNESGAKKIATLVAEGIVENKISPLNELVKDDFFNSYNIEVIY